ncbi:DNA-binding protein [Nakamurella sp. GG22]
MSFQPPVVALAELAKVLGVSRVRAMKLIERAEFPPPIAVLSVGRIWSYDAVVEYCERTGRKVHPLPDA